MLTKLQNEELGVIPKRFVYRMDLKNYDPALMQGIPVTFDTVGTEPITIDEDENGVALSIDSEATTANTVDIDGNTITTGKVIDISDLDAITSGKAIHIDATGVTQTSGILVHIDSASTALTSTGRLLLVDHTGAAAVSNINSEFKSAAADETVIVKINATAALAAGVCLDISAVALTTGKLIDMSDLDAITTGKAIHIDATGTTQTDGILVHLDSAGTALSATGRILLSDHTGATTTSGILNEFKTAANDETILMKLTAASLTTGTVLSVIGLDALTTGGAINVVSNSADTGTRALINVVNDNTAATGTTGLAIQNDATAGAHIALTGTGVLGINFTALGATDKLFDCTAASGCTAAPQTNAAVGFIGIKVAGTDQWIPYYDAT